MTATEMLRGVFEPPREPQDEYEVDRPVEGPLCPVPDAVHERGFYCTLPADHHGDHVAHGSRGKLHARWARRAA